MDGHNDPPRRIRVVGSSGAGKTTFARQVADRLGLAHRELDEVFWGADWTMRDPVEGRLILAEFLAGPGAFGWVVDGNWNSKIADLLDDADTIVWLDYPRRITMPRLIRRTVGRVITGRELWHGNRERLSNFFSLDPADNIILWSWTRHRQTRSEYASLAETDHRVVPLRSPAAARRWLEQWSTGSTTGVGRLA